MDLDDLNELVTAISDTLFELPDGLERAQAIFEMLAEVAASSSHGGTQSIEPVQALAAIDEPPSPKQDFLDTVNMLLLRDSDYRSMTSALLNPGRRTLPAALYEALNKLDHRPIFEVLLAKVGQSIVSSTTPEKDARAIVACALDIPALKDMATAQRLFLDFDAFNACFDSDVDANVERRRRVQQLIEEITD